MVVVTSDEKKTKRAGKKKDRKFAKHTAKTRKRRCSSVRAINDGSSEITAIDRLPCTLPALYSMLSTTVRNGSYPMSIRSLRTTMLVSVMLPKV